MHWLAWVILYLVFSYILQQKSPFVHNAWGYATSGAMVGYFYSVEQWGWVAFFVAMLLLNAWLDWYKPYRLGTRR